MENIIFKIGQPNTGKSYGFDKNYLEKNTFKEEIKYLKIPVSGGVGNEYKGLQNTDLAISYDPINETIRFGDFLKHLMHAITHPEKPHVVFLDDFHNQDISSLLSEYTPLFKTQQKRDISKQVQDMEQVPEILENQEFENVEEFIEKWNDFIGKLGGVPSVPITNRVSGPSLKLVFPANFYLLGAANFNEKTVNIFADWADRAKIEIVDPIEVQERDAFKGKISPENKAFVDCCKNLNEKLQEVLESQLIFDHEKYCFGIWKVVDDKGNIFTDGEKQKEIVKFFFSMIKNSLIYNNKNSYVNTIGWKLIKAMRDDQWFKSKFQNLFENETLLEKSTGEDDDSDREIFALLHEMQIYDN
jgi:hypothetical protein